MKTLRKALFGGLLALGLASPAFAFHCPVDAAAIDDALARSTLSAAEKAEIRAARDEGMELHNAGKHREAVDKLAEAMRMLLKGGLSE